MNKNKVIQKNIIEIKEKATLVITEDFLNQVKYVCNAISEVEWSGLIYFTTEGEPKNLSTFKVTPYYIHLMDKGTQGSTEFDDDGSQVELYKAVPELDPFEGNGYKYGKIHSHNTMDVFHSGTDMQDLQDQSEAYSPYYLSVIVNNFMDIEAKMSFIAEIPIQKINPLNFKGSKWELPSKKVLVTIDFDLVMPESSISIPEALKERTEKIIEEAKTVKWSGGYGYNQIGNGWEENDWETNVNKAVNFSTEDYRIKNAKTSLKSWLLDYFIKNPNPHFLQTGKKIEHVIAVFDELNSDELNSLVKAFIVHFNALGDWSRQNFVLLMEEGLEESNGNTSAFYGDEENIEILFEAIWNQIKLVD